MNLNIVVIGGNLTGDPELKYLPSGSAVAEFTVAINERWKKDDQAQEQTHFIRCHAFGKTAENIAKYFKKGERIIVNGGLSQDSWEDKETGKKREKTRVKVSSFEFVEKGNAAPKDAKPAGNAAPTNDEAVEDGIPF
jgi:single-strand DNA-binding protein